MEKGIEIYKVQKGEVVFNVEKETIWATIDQISKLFDVTRRSIEIHLNNIYKEGELDEDRTAKISFVVRQEGTRKVQRKVRIYNLKAHNLHQSIFAKLKSFQMILTSLLEFLFLLYFFLLR